MRKLLAFVLCMGLMLVSAYALAEKMEIQPPADTENFSIDPTNPLDCLANGYYVDDIVMEDGTARQVYHYYPEDLPYRRPVVFVGMPADESPETFLSDTGWKDIADQWGLMLALLTPGEGGWKEDEIEYTNKVYDFIQGRKYYTNDDSAYYLVGYGDAAKAMMAEAMVQANNYAGVAALGLEGDLSSAMAYAQETDLELMAVAPGQPGDPSVACKLSEIQIPVWIGAKEKDAGVTAVIEYWVKTNNCASFPSSNAYADEIYQPAAYLSTSNQLTYQELSKVMVSLGER
ncbi:MAG: hypothetical protein Q4G52_03830, partial [Clostridia bacterium]|nr:hypothetical protein [Clostridia bacterium]